MASKGNAVATAYVKLIPTFDGKLKKSISEQLGGVDSRGIGSKVGRLFSSGVDAGTANVGKAVESRLSTLTVAAGNLLADLTRSAGAAAKSAVSEAFSGYANYEQLVGGVDTLFKESSAKVQQYAANAYQTAGMSANQYMEQVTSFSASLLQGLGGDTSAAADYANMAMTDMSDNANKMGTSMEAITNAYQGFAKQNYTMLDNLKLGYGGTKGEMERLLKDASAIAGVEFNIDNYQDVIAAIHVMQTSMDISGYSVDELARKLSEMSLSADELQEVADSLGITYEEAVGRMRDGTLSARDAQVLLGTTAKEAATTIEGSLNMAKSAWSNFMTGLFDEKADIGDLFDKFATSAGLAMENIVPRLEVFARNVSEKMPEILSAAFSGMGDVVGPAIDKLFGEGTVERIQGVAEFAKGLGDQIVGGITERLGSLPTFFRNTFGWVKDSLPDIDFGALARGVVDVVGRIGDFKLDVFENVLVTFDQIIRQVRDVVGPAIEDLKPVLDRAGEAIRTFVSPIADFMQGNGPAFQGMMGRIRGHIDDLKPALELFSRAFGYLTEQMQPLAERIGPLIAEILGHIGSAIVAMAPIAVDLVAAVAAGLGFVAEGINVVWEVGENAAAGIQEGWNALKTFFEELPGNIEQFFKDLPENLGAIFDEVYEWGSGVFQDLQDFVEGIPDKIVGFFTDLGSKIIEAIGSITLPISLPDIQLPWNLGGAQIAGATYMAAGGIVNGATPIVAGEAGPEAVMPLTGSAMRPFAQAVAAEMGPTSVNNYTINGLSYADNARIEDAVLNLFKVMAAEGAM